MNDNRPCTCPPMERPHEHRALSPITHTHMENHMNQPTAQAPVTTKRAIIVVDRGWIFAGNVRRESGRIYLTDAVWVFGWRKVGFAAVIADARQADVRPIADLDIPEGSEIFAVPVPAGWGL